jgi:hypothetical protein
LGITLLTTQETLMQNLEHVIRERAYHLWVADGSPDGQADAYWLKAQREVLSNALGSALATAVAKTAPAADPQPKAVKAKAKAAAPAKKSKRRAA